MTNPQLHPLEVNPNTGEPFLRLPNHTNIIITPPRPDDAPAFLPYLNDPAVCDFLAGPPFPYTLEHAQDFLRRVSDSANDVLRQLEDTKDEKDLITVGGCPVRFIREVQEDGSDIFLGDIDLMRCMHGELMDLGAVDWDNKAKREEENNSLPLGDPSIVWSIGDYLAASHHGRGIMTAAVQAVLHNWGIPRMKIRYMMASAFTGNEGSVKVFLKNGFKLVKTSENHFEVKGKMRGLHMLEWKYSYEP